MFCVILCKYLNTYQTAMIREICDRFIHTFVRFNVTVLSIYKVQEALLLVFGNYLAASLNFDSDTNKTRSSCSIKMDLRLRNFNQRRQVPGNQRRVGVGLN